MVSIFITVIVCFDCGHSGKKGAFVIFLMS